MTTATDYYELLGVSRTADDATLKSAYRKLAMQWHPDRNPGDASAEARFKAISQAYDCLKDPQKRAAYDRFGHAAYESGMSGGGGGQGPEGFSDLGDIFDTIFGGGGGFGGAGGRRGPVRGADLRYDMEISLEEAYHGKASEITIDVAATCDTCEGKGAEPGTKVRTCNLCGGSGKMRAQQGFFVVERTCPNCHGSGKVIESPCRACGGEGRVDKAQTLSVDIPPGVDNGTRIRLSGKGEAGPNGMPSGDLYIFIHVARHRIFERDGTTLLTRAPISITTAALGGDIEIPGLDGSRHRIHIPAGIQSGKQLRQRGAGMPVLQGRGTGDMVIQIDVETPTKLTSRQKELLREFQATETGQESPESTGFFAKLKEMWDGIGE
ncbi:molecular chaperone DnaJ [Blastomonas sp.]|uniref:molecular chaperone DnaJ n=1 Tax=Blastomonas sp. TaxID=1909299 RepID=UPI003593340F